MRKQRSPCTIPSSHPNLSERETSSSGSCINEDQWRRFSNFWSQYEVDDPDQDSNSSFDQYLVDENAFNYIAPQTPYTHPYAAPNDQASYAFTAPNVRPVGDYWQPGEPFYPLQHTSNARDFTETNPLHYDAAIDPPSLQYGIPTVTSYGAVTLLLRNLVRVDVTCSGSASLYNFPAMSITSLSASGKCYVDHPNGRVYHDGSDVHMVTANSRYARITSKGILFSPTPHGPAYVIDESGTKTTTAKFNELGKDLAMSVFYDGNRWSYDRLREESYRMAVETKYQSYPNGCEAWLIGRVRIVQDKWGEVTVNQRNDERRSIMASPTVRRATVWSPELTISIDCYSRNYFSVLRAHCCVTSGFCGLIVKHRSQKAGIDRLGRLVLF